MVITDARTGKTMFMFPVLLAQSRVVAVVVSPLLVLMDDQVCGLYGEFLEIPLT
jgi:superfamily II DNA helicase RecQ